MAKQARKLIANNKKVYHDYFLEETFEAGIALAGTEVKSMRMGKCSIKESFIHIENGEVILYGMHISPYEKGNIFNKDPLRTAQAFDAQERNSKACRKDCAERLYHCSGGSILQRKSCKSSGRIGKRKEAL